MDAAVARYCPVLEPLGRYHWSVMQAEYATDIVFRSQATLAPFYDNRSLREHLKRFGSAQVSRLLKRLRLHGIIKKVGKTYKHYLTELGRHVAIAGLTLKNLFLVPEFAVALTH